jgi:hypothetical protein
VRREEGAVPPILPAADEEGLDAHGPALAGQREDVGVAEPLGMHRLAALDVGQRAQAVAVDGGKLEILLLGRLGHLLASRACTPVDLPARKFLASSTSSA